MALENMTDMLAAARAGKYAVGAFNMVDYNSTKAIAAAAEEVKAPVIIQTSAKTVVFWGAEAIVTWVREIAAESAAPVALHLDHCKDLELIKACIDSGWTSVMIDASSKPLEDNISLSKLVVEMARPNNVTVEAELGAIVGVEDDIHVKEQDSHLANPEDAIRFYEEVLPDCFAPAIGTAHGLYKGEPSIAFDVLERIARETNVPLALHGGTGLSEQVFKRCISLGCCKVNISTQLKHTFIDSFVGYHQANGMQYDPLKVIGAQFEQVKQMVAENIRLFGGAGKA
jgi:ketose-bisphosphate aldolase